MKTTDKHFNIFKNECLKWIKSFGLFGWRFYFSHSRNKEASIGWCEYPRQLQDRVFTIGLDPEVDFDLTVSDIKKTAFHEVMESFLYRVQALAKSRTVFDSEIEEEIHNIIRTLEVVVFDKGELVDK